jgi:hypothetical protein
MYAVARRALIAGEDEGKSRANSFAAYEAVSGALRSLSALSDWTIEHSLSSISSFSTRKKAFDINSVRYVFLPVAFPPRLHCLVSSSCHLSKWLQRLLSTRLRKQRKEQEHVDYIPSASSSEVVPFNRLLGSVTEAHASPAFD